ncbi:MAG: hypothetical protein QM831_09360 [Kofleriaceae bacterium]
MTIARAIANNQQRRAVVLYGDDGRIIHTHVMYCLNGAMPHSWEDAEKRAMDVARDLGRDVDHAKALRIEDPSVLTSGRFVVKDGALTAVPVVKPDTARTTPASDVRRVS